MTEQGLRIERRESLNSPRWRALEPWRLRDYFGEGNARARSALLPRASRETRADGMSLLQADRPELVARGAVGVDRVEHIKKAEQNDAAVTVLHHLLLALQTCCCERDAVVRKLVSDALASTGNAVGCRLHLAVIAHLG